MKTYPYRQTAFQLFEAGYNPLPIIPRTKRPALKGWQRYSHEQISLDVVERYARSDTPYGVGVAMGWLGLVAIDIDTDEPEILQAILGVLP